MNSSYVETDEEQRRWFSTLAYDQAIQYGDGIVETGYMEAQYRSGGYLDYPNQQIDDSTVYGGCAYQDQPQQQSTATSNRPSWGSEALTFGVECKDSSPPAWYCPQVATCSTAAFSTPYEYQHIPLQAPSGQTLQMIQPSQYSADSVTNTQVPSADAGPDLPSSNAEFFYSPTTPEERRFDPPMTSYVDGALPRQQHPRFVGDEYAASWVRGTGVERVGWCGFCPTWHRLKDSAYWYHMHYSHGISCVTGKPFKEPLDWRHKHGITAYEALCGGCDKWVYIGKLERWRTPYFRHAYKCQTKTSPNLNTSRIRSKSSSRKPKLSIRSESF